MFNVLTSPLPALRPFPEGFENTRLHTVWHTIREDIFFLIDCEPLRPLYSDIGRSSTPVNVLLLLAVIAKMEHKSLKVFCRDLPGNLNAQYAVRAECLAALPSESTVKRFGRLITRYNKENQTDLLELTVSRLSISLTTRMGLVREQARIDTVMVNIYATTLSRYQLIYVCTAKLVRVLAKAGVTLPDRLQHFTDDGDFNFMTYHNTTDSEETKMELLLEDAVTARTLCGKSVRETSEYQTLERCLREQTFTGEDGKLHLRKKGDKALNSGILQSDVDPDATYRSKRGEEHRGYSLCVIDISNGRHHLVIAYCVFPNNVSDGEIASKLLSMLPPQDVAVTLVADGGFVGEMLKKIAQEKGWKIVNTDLPGRKTADCFADTQFNDAGTELYSCPNGKAPDHFSYYEKTESVTGWFTKDACEGCPLKEQCHPKEQKQFYVRRFSVKQKNRALSQRNRSTEEFKAFSHFRNGVESIFSVLRRYYRIDEISSHGLYRVTYHIGLMILAMNIQAFHADKMDKERKKTG